MKLLLSVCFACLSCLPLMGQNSYMQWQNGDHHVLGLFFPAKPIETQEAKSPWYRNKYLKALNDIRDTFFFKNMSDQTLIIKKIHVKDTSLYTYTKSTAPGKIGYVVYHTTLNAHTAGIDNVVVRFNVMTNFSPWVMCETNYIVIGNYNASKVENKEQYSIVYTEVIDSFMHKKLFCDGKNRPVSMGLVHARTGDRLHTWNFWDPVGRMPDSIFKKSVFVFVKEDYNCQRYQLKILCKQDGVWQNAICRPAGNHYQVIVDEQTDSLFLYNDTVYVKLDVRYSKSAEIIHFFAVNVIRYSDDYLAYAYNMNGFAFVPDQYAIVFDEALSVDVFEEMERLKSRHPLLNFEIMNDQLLLVTLPKQRYWVDEHYLNKLLKDNKIDYLSQTLKSREHGFTYLKKSVMIRSIIIEVADASDSLIQSYGFTLSTKYPNLGWVQLEYKDRIINRNFCARFNALGEVPLFEDRVPEWFMYRRPATHEPDLDIIKD